VTGGRSPGLPADSGGAPNTVPARLASPSEERELARVRGKFRLSEKEWQAQVVEIARLYGWRVFHPLRSMGSEPGWADLALLRPPKLLLVELRKTDTGRPTPAQREWLADLELVASTSCGALHVDLWRPADFDRVHRLLKREGS
jgi:hypothetical protein